MIRVLYQGTPVMIFPDRKAASEYIARHTPEMQRRMGILETQEKSNGPRPQS